MSCPRAAIHQAIVLLWPHHQPLTGAGADGPYWVPAMAFPRTHVSSHHCSMPPGLPSPPPQWHYDPGDANAGPDTSPWFSHCITVQSPSFPCHITLNSTACQFQKCKRTILPTIPFNTLCKCAVLQIRAKLYIRITIAFHPSFSSPQCEC